MSVACLPFVSCAPSAALSCPNKLHACMSQQVGLRQGQLSATDTDVCLSRPNKAAERGFYDCAFLIVGGGRDCLVTGISHSGEKIWLRKEWFMYAGSPPSTAHPLHGQAAR